MMKKVLFVFITLAFTASVNAQNILHDLRQDQQGQGKIIINQSAEIDQLVRQNPVEQTPTDNKVQDNKNNNRPEVKPESSANHAENKPEHPSNRVDSRNDIHKPDPSVEHEEEARSNSNKIMRNSYKTKGYRIQVYVGAGPDKRTEEQECMKAQQKMKQMFPDIPVYSHFYSPHWKCRIGNFTNLAEAQKILHQVKKAGFPKACIVKGTISVAKQ